MRILRATLVFKRMDGIKDKFDCFSVGGFEAISKDGRKYQFDFDSMEGYFDEDKGEVTCFLTHFNAEDYYEEENRKRGVDSKEINGEFIRDSQLIEVFYEAFNDHEEDEVIPLDLIHFELLEDGISYRFPKEDLEKFNEKYALYRQL